MKRIYNGQVGQIVPAQNGIVFAIGEETFDGQIAVSYKFYSFDLRRVEKVDRSAYLMAKFGQNYTRYIAHLPDFINCHVTAVFDEHKLVVQPDGSAMIMDDMGSVCWKGDLTYHDAKPLDVVSDGVYVWVSYPDANCVVKYDARNMHQMFRAGSTEDDAFLRPCGLTIRDNKLVVCCTESHEIKAFNTDTYDLRVYAKLSEPIYRYYQVGVNEVVLLETGVYIF